MARVVVLGAGIAGHTASTFLKKWLGKKHEVIVVSPNSNWQWVPSNIWIGVGYMKPKDVKVDLRKVYSKAGIEFKQAKALSIHPDENYITIEYTDPSKKGQKETVKYDYLINATGPKLNFAATPGLGPDHGHTTSVCTYSHAEEAFEKLQASVEKMKKGQRQKILVGLGHGMCTCQGAAFEYILNVEHYIRSQGVRDMADITYITNEYELGDLGMGGMQVKVGGYITSSKIFVESVFAEREINWIKRVHINKVEAGKAYYEDLDGNFGEVEFDFAMLIPPFAGAGIKAYDKNGNDITSELFNPGGFMFVDADYSSAKKDYYEWKASDWPKTYQNPKYKNIFAAGIAFAPPHLISKPMKSPNGTPINPTPPRTGMPSAIIAKVVAENVRDLVLGKSTEPHHTASMASMGAACVVSMGPGVFKGMAATMTVYPVVPDFDKYEFGRDLEFTIGEVGLAGHWLKHMLHYVFIYKAKLLPGWTIIPE